MAQLLAFLGLLGVLAFIMLVTALFDRDIKCEICKKPTQQDAIRYLSLIDGSDWLIAACVTCTPKAIAVVNESIRRQGGLKP